MSFIDLTNAPTPPRWFEFLLEPGRLQQHLETDRCDPSPLQLITLFLKNTNGSEPSETNEIAAPIPLDSFEAKYRQRKSEALQILSIKVASYLNWDLDVICNGVLSIPIQYKLMQSFVELCSQGECPLSIKKFSTVINCHWFLRSAIAYNLSTLEPQTCSTTMIYLSSLQQQQQAADDMALSNVGILLANTSHQVRTCADELRSYVKELVTFKENNSAKRIKSGHPFDKAELSRPSMDCFDPFKDNDWKQSIRINAHEILEAACYDLGRFYFFEESYEDARDTFEIIRSSSDKYPLLEEYLQSANDIITKNAKPTIESQLTIQTNARRERTEKYLFDCMTQFAQSKKNDGDEKMDTNGCGESIVEKKEDSDLRFDQQTIAARQQLPENSPWFLQVPADYQQQRMLELGKGDMCMSRGDFDQAMGCFVSALMLMSDYFRKFSKNYIDEEPYITRMIQCSISLSCYTQAVALCQMTKSLNYTIAFKQLNERICNDCCDDIYECIWNVTILEYIINLHARRGEVERRTRAIQLIGQLELNENNPEDILREAEHVRRGRFFRIMSNKYL